MALAFASLENANPVLGGEARAVQPKQSASGVRHSTAHINSTGIVWAWGM
ncbi:hypothetical protein [Coleofasciculus sp. G2-EDA-02]